MPIPPCWLRGAGSAGSPPEVPSIEPSLQRFLLRPGGCPEVEEEPLIEVDTTGPWGWHGPGALEQDGGSDLLVSSWECRLTTGGADRGAASSVSVEDGVDELDVGLCPCTGLGPADISATPVACIDAVPSTGIDPEQGDPAQSLDSPVAQHQ